jgi:hypothetical protein
MKFQQQGCRFCIISASLVLWCFHMFCGFVLCVGSLIISFKY